MSEPTDDFEYERRFFCRELPAEYDDGDAPPLIIQRYYVHADNYALRVRLVSRKVHVDMTPDVNPVAVLDEYRDRFSEAYVTVKGPSVGGTRYEVEREIDTRIAAELIKRGGSVIIKNRYSVWIEEDGWSVDGVRRAECAAHRSRGRTIRAGYQSDDSEILHHRNHRSGAIQ